MNSTHLEDREAVPLVIVEGFLCSTSTAVWGNFANHLEAGSERQAQKGRIAYGGRRQVVLVPIGPLSSIHDRACELFHGLRGTRVDYGHSHASQHGHGRFGRRARKPLLAGWGDNVDNKSLIGKAHFLGHSLGGLTIVKMFELLSQGFFDAYLGIGVTNSKQHVTATSLVLSLTTISSPFRGTPLVYLLGLQATSLPLVRFLSVGDCLAKIVHFLLWVRRLPLAQSRLFNVDKWIPDFYADAWHFASQTKDEYCVGTTVGKMGSGSNTCCSKQFEHELQDDCHNVKTSARWRLSERFGLTTLLSQLKNSSWAEGKDCAPWDCSFAQREAEEEREGSIWSSPSFPSHGVNSGSSSKVWLRSYAAYIEDTGGATSTRCMPSVLSWIGSHLSKYNYANSPPPGSRHSSSKADDRHHNDSGYTSACDEADQMPSSREKRTEKMIKIDQDWYRNDGVVPLASQYHPGNCHADHCVHRPWQDVMEPSTASLLARLHSSIQWLFPSYFTSRDQRKRGLPNAARVYDSTNEPVSKTPSSNSWHVFTLQDTTHASLVPFYTGSAKQVSFWQDVGSWLQQVELAASTQFDGAHDG
ncbi:hypothetical protein CBS101457_000466 [Exobasidium rhododendri]|nr:hypothetical protein CBS101457_000466 [Exobasidium rhododendri]